MVVFYFGTFVHEEGEEVKVKEEDGMKLILREAARKKKIPEKMRLPGQPARKRLKRKRQKMTSKLPKQGPVNN